MTILRMDTEQTENLVNNIRQTTEGIETELGVMRNHMNAIGGYWQGPSSQQFGELLANLAAQMETAKENGLTLGQRLSAEIAQWMETAALLDGGTAAGGIAGGMFAKEMTLVSAAAGSDSMDTPGNASTTVSNVKDVYEDGRTLINTGKLVQGADLKDGILHLKGSHELKESLGLASHLNVISPANLPSHLLKQGFKTASWGVLDYGLNISETWTDHASEYATYTPTQHLAAAATDAQLALIPSVASTVTRVVGGALMAGAVVGVLTIAAPALVATAAGATFATAVGATLIGAGALVGAVALPSIAGETGKQYVGSLAGTGIRDSMIQWNEANIKNTIGESGAQQTVEQIKYLDENVVRPIDQNIVRPIDQNIVRPIDQNVLRPIDQNLLFPAQRIIYKVMVEPVVQAIQYASKLKPI